MKKRLIGVSDISSYVDKRTGQNKLYLSLYIMGQENRVFGFSASNVFLNEDSPFFDMFNQLIHMRAINQVINKDVHISFTQRGYLDEFEFVDDIPILKSIKSSYSSPMDDFPFDNNPIGVSEDKSNNKIKE